MANSSPLLLLFFHRASPKFLKERSTIWLRLLHDSSKLALQYLISGSFLSHKRHEKERQKTRKRTAQLREAKTEASPEKAKETGILQTLKTSEKREPKEAERKMISSFAQVPIFLRPGNIHVPVIFEWSTSSLETTKAANNCVTDSSSCSIQGERDWEGPMPPVAIRFGYCSIHRERVREGLLPQNMSLLQKYCVLLFFPRLPLARSIFFSTRKR
jgi:hypothetical protein